MSILHIDNVSLARTLNKHLLRPLGLDYVYHIHRREGYLEINNPTYHIKIDSNLNVLVIVNNNNAKIIPIDKLTLVEVLEIIANETSSSK